MVVFRKSADSNYACDISVSPFTGAKSYNCGPNSPGYVELVIHGKNNEYYKAQSGTITVSQADVSHFKATFNVTTKGYNNGKTVNLQGSVLRVR
jgi:hypothetical protein